MAQSYELILKGGTVVNHDGEGPCDLGIVAIQLIRDRRQRKDNEAEPSNHR